MDNPNPDREFEAGGYRVSDVVLHFFVVRITFLYNIHRFYKIIDRFYKKVVHDSQTLAVSRSQAQGQA